MRVHFGWFMVILFCLAMYPCNFAMMKTGVGVYNNDPLHEWFLGENQIGPSPMLRSISLVLSPVFAPLNGLHWLVESTYEGIDPPEPRETKPAPMPYGALSPQDVDRLYKKAIERDKKK